MAVGQMTDSEYEHHKKDVYKTTWILAFVTIFEVGTALFYEFYLMENYGFPRLPLNIFVILATLVKAYWIMFVFMHVKHENTWFQRTIFLPFVFLIWAIIAFCWEGSYWSGMRDLLNSFI